MSDAPNDALARVHAAVDLTRAAGTASLTYENVDPTMPEFDTLGTPGELDFARWRVRFADSAEEGGRRTIAGGGTLGEPDDPLLAGGPLWLLETLRGAVRAVPPEHQPAEGAECYDVDIDLVAADRASPVSLASPGGFAIADLLRVPGRVELDPQGRVRQLELTLNTMTTTLRLRLEST